MFFTKVSRMFLWYTVMSRNMEILTTNPLSVYSNIEEEWEFKGDGVNLKRKFHMEIEY